MSDFSDIIFGGDPSRPASLAGAIDWDAVRARQPRWVRLLEEAYSKVALTDKGRALYGDPNKGATILQSWNTYGLIRGTHPVCILATGRPPATTSGIPPPLNVTMAPAAIADAAIAAVRAGYGVQTFTFDGRVGHCITILDYDQGQSRFRYHDTWPERSLLCKENNAAGVDAKLDPDGRWTITKLEFALVVYTVFLSQRAWAELNGVSCEITYSAFTKSDFWAFFNLSELHRRTVQRDGENDFIVIHLQPGGFKGYIKLCLALTETRSIVHGELTLDRGWMVGPPFGLNPFALDVTTSFLRALTPTPERNLPVETGTLVELNDPEKSQLLIDGEKEGKRSCAPLQCVYLGLTERHSRSSDFATLVARNFLRNEKPFFRLKLDLRAEF